MRNPISSAPRYAEFSGFDDIAKRLTETYKDTFDGIKPRSLSIYIGELDRGKVTWWIKRPDQTQCLAEFLGIDQDELSIQQNSGRHVFSFPGFKDCPPLDLMREDTWQIAEPRLVSDIQGVLNSRFYVKPTLDVWKYAEAAVWRSSDIEWLQIPDDVEYQLLTRKLAALRPHGISERRSITDCGQAALCINRVEHAGGCRIESLKSSFAGGQRFDRSHCLLAKLQPLYDRAGE